MANNLCNPIPVLLPCLALKLNSLHKQAIQEPYSHA